MYEAVETEIFSDHFKDRVIDYYVNEVGYQILEFPEGFVFFSILDDSFVIEEMFIGESKGLHSYGVIIKYIKKFCEKNDLTSIRGVVHLCKANANSLIKLHLRYGGEIVAAQNDIVEIYAEV